MRRRVRFIGITERTRNSPNSWRWYQHAHGQLPFAIVFAKCLRSISSVDGLPVLRFVRLTPVCCGASAESPIPDYQKKVSRWYPPDAWGDEQFSRPPREDANLEALRLAARIHALGNDTAERERFAALLFARPEVADLAPEHRCRDSVAER